MTRASRRVLALFAVAAFAACSSSSGSDAGSGPTITSFTATPNSLPTAGGSVTLAWNVTGATSLSIDHAVGAVTPLTTGSMSVQVTTTTTFTLTATDASGSTTQTAMVTVAAPITVAGTVTDEFGNPAAGATVLIASGTFSQSTVTDANGAFSVPGVPTPYNATIINSTQKRATQWQGLTRTDPTIFDITTTTAPRSAALAGALSGGNLPLPADYTASAVFASPQVNFVSGSDLTVVTAGTFTGSVHWSGPSTTTGSLYALETHNDHTSGLPVDYPGYGTTSGVLLQDMGTLSGQAVALTPVTAGAVTGTVTVGTGFTFSGIDMFFLPAPGAVISLLSDGTASTSFSYVTPAVADATFTVLALGKGTTTQVSLAKKAGVAANATVALDIPVSPTLTLPVSAATDVTVMTPFSWTNYTGVYVVVFGSATPEYVVVTSAQTVTIPDFTAQGLPLPASTGYTWEVIGIGPSTSVDSFAIAGGGLIGVELLQDGYLSASEERSFTTGP
jgi:hypothetical protein